MIFDIAIAALFLLAFVVPANRALLWVYAVTLGFILEAFSPFIPGLASLLLLCGLWIALRFLEVFDASSRVSFGFALTASIGCYAALSSVAFALSAEAGTGALDVLLRGGVFALRLLFASLGVILFVWGVRYGVSLMRYAVLEKRI